MNTLTETQVRLFASTQSWIEGEAVHQLYATAKLDGMRLGVGFPDLHPGKGTPVGAAFVAEGVIYPHLIGGDIGCGMALFKTDLLRRDAKLDRWVKLPFNLEHPWDHPVSDFLAEHDLESTEFDSALGTIGGGNHFAELQAVEKVLDAAEFKKLDLGKQQLVALVHSGSRGLGETILRAHVDQHFGEGVEAESFAAEEYLRRHDFAVRWAKASRTIRDDARLYFRRTTLSAEDEVPQNGVGAGEPKYRDSYFEIDPDEGDYARVLQIINEFLPVKEMAGLLIGVPVLKQFGLVENEKVDRFLATVFSKSPESTEPALNPKRQRRVRGSETVRERKIQR